MISIQEWLYNQEPEFYESPEKALEWLKKLLTQSPHGGDCTGMPGSCPLCTLERLLCDYRGDTLKSEA